MGKAFRRDAGKWYVVELDDEYKDARPGDVFINEVTDVVTVVKDDGTHLIIEEDDEDND